MRLLYQLHNKKIIMIIGVIINYQLFPDATNQLNNQLQFDWYIFNNIIFSYERRELFFNIKIIKKNRKLEKTTKLVAAVYIGDKIINSTFLTNFFKGDFWH